MHEYDKDLGLFYGGEIKKAEKMKKESAVFTDEVLYGKTPQALLRDPKLKPQAKALYGILHTYSQPKDLKSNPHTFVSQKKLAKDLGMSVRNVRRFLKELEDSGWTTTERKGLNMSNSITLHSKKKRRK
jgi:biotin operon repressor